MRFLRGLLVSLSSRSQHGLDHQGSGVGVVQFRLHHAQDVSFGGSGFQTLDHSDHQSVQRLQPSEDAALMFLADIGPCLSPVDVYAVGLFRALEDAIAEKLVNSGSRAIACEQHYLREFEHDAAGLFDEPEFTLLKVVCNVRNYFGMSLDQTVMLMECLFSPRSAIRWSRESIALSWELVADYTPLLGLKDPVAIAEQKRRDLEAVVTDLLAHTRAGGRVSTEDFYRKLKEWNHDLDATKTAVSQAVRAITGIGPKSYREGRCYRGFHFPTAEELKDPLRQPGEETSAMEAPPRPVQVVPLLSTKSLDDARPRAS